MYLCTHTYTHTHINRCQTPTTFVNWSLATGTRTEEVRGCSRSDCLYLYICVYIYTLTHPDHGGDVVSRHRVPEKKDRW